MSIRLESRGDLAFVIIDNPPVNALSAGVPEAIADGIARAAADPGVRAVIFMAAGRTFIAGADIHELERAAWDPSASLPEMHDILRSIEDTPKPVIMAIHGTALGGGVELAMAAHYRVATREARLGQPEVNLGIIPGAEGTQRLPRLVGVEKAIEMCVTGKPITAPDALAAGLIDRVIDGDLREGAAAFAREVIASAATSDRQMSPRTRDRNDRLGTPAANAPLLAAGRAMAQKTRPHQPAALAAVDAIEAATTLPFDEGCARERELFFTRCVRTDACRALVHAFVAERAVSRVPDLPADAPVTAIATVAIIGAGTMGAGIAMACANAGLEVTVTDVAKERLQAGLATVRKNYESSIKRGRLTPQQVDERIGRIRTAAGYDACESADLVIEAVFESMDLKKEVFAALDHFAKPGAILATNTSTLDIDEIAGVTQRPESVVGLHFFSPAHVMRLVEIVRGAATSAGVLATGLALAKRLGKVGVVVRNGVGFVGNRIMFPYMYEAQFLAEEGATPEQIDRVLTGWGMAMGIFAVDDLGGLDVAWRCRRELHQFDDPELRQPLVADTLVAMKRLGQKTGKGWYRYEAGDRTPIADPEVTAIIERTATGAAIRRAPKSDRDILERCLFAMINEGARVLDEGIASRAADIDVIYLTGYGFPAYRGGPMFYADTVGLRHVYERVTAFHREHGKRWVPAPLLERLAREGSSFREYDRHHHKEWR
ncbi:MAG TPA: 3-hydroxyacyl-CoA dehydrogenase NAD-binding domain-containing protein [Vicinamibacterales bacterium]|nr:3-hydroxyacyl-CoA dehydrogenase NAD-binding domain-containing protein [Vicinamibacterales bacterium]